MGSYTVGLDLGQSQDFSALAVVERVRVLPAGVSAQWWSQRWELAREHGTSLAAVGAPEPVEELRVRHLQRWQIGTPYPAVVDDVVSIMAREPLASDGLLFVDGTGVGAAVTDMMFDAARGVEGRPRLRGCHYPVKVTITGGEGRNGWNIPKADLFSALQVALQQGRLRIAEGLLLADVLERELLAFRLKITPGGRATFDVQRREGEGHGDLVLALCLALVAPNTLRRPEIVEASAVSPHADAPA